jgi:competence protein ComGF
MSEKMKKEEGFTLLEVLVALSISSLCFLLLAIGVKQTQHIKAQVNQDAQLEWHLFLNQLEYELQESELIRVSRDALVVKKKNPEKGIEEEISFSRYFKMIRRQVGNAGHQPMLTRFETFAFSKEDNKVILTVTFPDASTYVARIWIDSWDEGKDEK